MATAQEPQPPDNRKTEALDPIGSALRTTWPSDNHDSLGSDLTGLMLELARVEPPPPPAAAPAPPPAAPSWLRRLFGRKQA